MFYFYLLHMHLHSKQLIRHYTEKHLSEFNFNMLSDTCFEGYEHFTNILTKKNILQFFFLLRYHVNDSCYKKNYIEARGQYTN